MRGSAAKLLMGDSKIVFVPGCVHAFQVSRRSRKEHE
jgi:hypothetical protein